MVIPEEWQSFFSHVSDSTIYFSNDSSNIRYRLVIFMFEGEFYRIATNRIDLTTGEIIMLYAYRWQIELFFRSTKRTFHALHLWSHDEKGIEVQFYIYLIAYLLLLHFKQSLVQEQIQEEVNNKADNEEPNSILKENHSTRTPVRGLVTLLGGKLKLFWKMSIHWIKCIQNLLFESLTPDIKTTILAVK